MLRQALAVVLGDSGRASTVLETAGIDPTARGEQLTVLEFLHVARAADRPA
jgi:16S rRNA (adenine1518-N6/adenine1519-N6)-dimethyltransferase